MNIETSGSERKIETLGSQFATKNPKVFMHFGLYLLTFVHSHCREVRPRNVY